MHLISALASGVNGAANGTALLLARGSSLPVVYYKDFEATQAIQSTLSGVALDANGSFIAYVNQLTDVKVLDVNGAVLREFVSADNATSVEVINPSFTGVDYVTGVSAANKPTTLDAILSLVLASFGSTNFNVLALGSSVTLQSAIAGLAGLFYNVKSYGAIGDGVADDGASITAAITAAAASVGTGGIVFFPPGRYRSTSIITLPSGVSMMGAGGVSSKLQWDSAVIAEGLLVSTAQGGVTRISGMWFGSVNTNFTAPLIQVNIGGLVTIEDCLFGGELTTKGKNIVWNGAGISSALTHLVVERCMLQNNADLPLITQTSTGRLSVRSCTLLLYGGNILGGAYSSAVADLVGNFLIDNCRLDATLLTGGTCTYIQFAPTALMASCSVTNCKFSGVFGAVVVPTALKNTLAVPLYDAMESGNTFGDSVGSVTPYAYTTDGYADIVNEGSTCRYHGSRVGRVATYITNGNQQIDPKQYGVIFIKRTAAGAQTLTATKGSLGDKVTVAILNETAGALTPVFGGPDFAMDPTLGGAALNANANTRSYVTFEWMSVNPSGTGGQWVQISKANQNVA